MNGCHFPKSERLCSKKLIEALFEGGHKSLSAYPIRAVFMPIAPNPSDGSTPIQPTTSAPTPLAQVMMSVSKRHFKHAVDRNRVKRQLRETYRLNKHLLADKLQQQHLVIAFIWLSDDLFKTSVVQSKMKKLLLRISEEISTQA